MKKFVLFVLCILAVGLSNAAVNTEYYGKSPRILVTLASQDPDPVEPGKIVELSFKLDNQGEMASGVTFEMIPEYPFSLQPGELASKNVGTLGTSQNGERNVFVKFKMKVDQNAVDNAYEVKVRYKTGDSESWVTIDDIPVKVQSKDAILSVERFTANPDTVSPGSKTKLTISLRNHAASLIKDIKVLLDLGLSGDDTTPFSPIGSTNEKVVSSIDSRSSANLDFDLVVDPDAKSQVYKIPLKLAYSDNLNKNYSKILLLSLVVGGEPDISAYIDGTTIYKAGKNGETTIKIVNKGLTDVKFLSARLSKGDNYKILSPENVYVGNIDSDDYETVDFKLGVNKDVKDKIVLPLSIEYKDSNNRNYKRDASLELPIYTSSEARSLGLEDNGNEMAIFVVIAVLVIGFFAYRSWKKRKK